MNTPPSNPRFEIRPRQPGRFRAVALALALCAGVLAGLGLGWWWWAPSAGDPQSKLADVERVAAQRQGRLSELEQRVATLTRSDQISREANADLQSALSEKDEEIAGLRADIAFYERFVGNSGPRRGLAVHSAEFTQEAGGSWRYQVVLTQSINRGGLTRGQMRLAVEGVRDGKLATLDWNALHQKPVAEPQAFSFRYFQRLGGSIVLPPGFTPQRAKVSLRGAANVDQAFPWTLSATPGET